MTHRTSPHRTIPTELFLLLTNDAGRQDATQYRRQALAAAAVVELTLRQKVSLGDERNPRVEVTDREPTGLPELDPALAAIDALDGKRIKTVIGHRSLDLTEAIGELLAAEDVVQRKDGWFTTTWPMHDDTVETSLRARLATALTAPERASLQDGILLELLRALRIAHRILRDEAEGMGRREIDERIRGMRIDHPAAVAVRRILDDMNAALIAASTAGGAAAVS